MKVANYYYLWLLVLIIACEPKPVVQSEAPNIVLIIADDWSYPHAGAYGDQSVQTPHFDRIANEGVLFEHAYVSSPSCTPSRAAVLTGQEFWRLGQGANLYGPLSPEIPVYPDLLEEVGYYVGYSKKGWGPGAHEGRNRNPAGDKYGDFASFINNRPPGRPFCYWYGSHNPHRGYEKGAGIKAGIDPTTIALPACFPDHEMVRSDMADYYEEVQAFDAEIGVILAELEAKGELDHTMIIITSDNGMPFPRCKSNVYDMGTRVPLAIRWGESIQTPTKSDAFVSLTDLAPTILQIAGLQAPEQMTGSTILPVLLGEDMEDPAYRSKIFFGKERHVPGQEAGDWGGYPSRAIRTHDYLLIHNFRPDRWPAGTPDYEKATFFPSAYGDVDGGPTRSYMIQNRHNDALHEQLFAQSFEKRPEWELYDLKQDPGQLQNLAEQSNLASIRTDLTNQLADYLKLTNDPRIHESAEIFESYPYTGGTPLPDHFERQSQHYATVKIDSFPSAHILPRSVEILLPVHVHQDQRFPVLYMFDGQNLFHEFKGWGGEINKGWQVDRVLDSLKRAGSIDGLIVVGIHNNQNRMADYMPAKPKELLAQRIAETDHEWYSAFKENPPKSDDHLRFIVEELKPYIDKHFNTKVEAAHTFVAGSSMGGLISLYAICEYPEVFGGAACFSTHWPPLDGVFLEYVKENLPDPARHKLYFDHGTEALDAEYEPYQKIADAAGLANGYTIDQNWMSRKFEGAKHHESDWHARFHIPIEFLLKE